MAIHVGILVSIPNPRAKQLAGERSPVENLYERAQSVLPGGVTAAARANPALGKPFYVARAEGPYLYDDAGRQFIETCMSNGATLLGHAYPAVAAAVRRAVELGLACAYDGPADPSRRKAGRADPLVGVVRFSTSGTEATFYPIRIARASPAGPRPQVRGTVSRFQRSAGLQHAVGTSGD